MNKTYLRSWMLVALLAFFVSGCENEPLEGQFITDEQGSAEEGQFIANVGGEDFIAEVVTAIFNPNLNSIVISGSKPNGESITLGVVNVGVSTFDLGTGGGQQNSGIYIAPGEPLDPYITLAASGGSGQLEITVFDTDAKTVSGNFNLVGVRQQTDDDGNPVLDGNGNPVFESINITNGSFTTITYTEDTSGGGGGGGATDPEASFFAFVDGVEFMETSFTIEELVVSGVEMLKLEATMATGERIRIDIPKSLGVGTYSFVDPISDGTKLIAVYTAGDNTLTSESGSITITEFGNVTGKLAATFNFVGSDPIDPGNPTTVNVTEGAFNIDFINDSGTVENSFSADIDSVGYTPTSIEVSQVPFNGTTLFYVTTIDDVSNQSLTIAFPMDIVAGSYAMTTEFVDGTENVGLYNPDIGNSVLFASSSGVLTIGSYELSTGVIEATFEFTAVDPDGGNTTEYAITNGQFVVNTL